jgi:hypothetical protein
MVIDRNYPPYIIHIRCVTMSRVTLFLRSKMKSRAVTGRRVLIRESNTSPFCVNPHVSKHLVVEKLF